MFSKRIAAVLLAVLAAGSFAAGNLAAQSRVQLKIASVAPSRSPWDIEQRALAQEWSEITKGLVSVTFFDAGTLGGEKGVIQKLRSGRPGQKAPLDGVIFTTIGLHELAPAASIYTLSIPFAIRNQNELNVVLDHFGPGLKETYRTAGYEIIAWTNVGWLSFYTKKPFSNLAELKGIKIASAGLDSPVLGNTFRAGGFNIEDITSEKLLQEMKGSNLQGFFGVHMYAYVTGLSKTIGYALDTKLCPVMAGIAVSNEAWARIPPEYKPAMMEAVARMKTRLEASLEASDRGYMDSMKKEGVTAIVPTAAELEAWEKDFAHDIDQANRSSPGAFNMDLYRKIQALLQESRKNGK